MAAKKGKGSERRHGTIAVMLCGMVLGMLGLSYAAVPLYQIFCQVTGFGGTTQRAEEAPDTVLQKRVTVRLDANLAQDMPWRFTPVQQTLSVKIGESVLAFYEASNDTEEAVTGTATFNVTPEAAGLHFQKIDCFCFTEQTLAPGESVRMPVNFFIDPEIVKDPDARNITEITLSYTFFPVAKDADVASAPGTVGRGG